MTEPGGGPLERLRGAEVRDAGPLLIPVLDLIKGEDPAAEDAARAVIAALRRGVEAPPDFMTALNTRRGAAALPSRILLDGLAAFLGDQEARDTLAAFFKPGRPELSQNLLLYRLLEAVGWLRDPAVIKVVKRAARRLEGGPLDGASMRQAQALADFAKAHRPATKVQRQQLSDLFLRLSLDEERIEKLLAPCGADALEDLLQGEARRLVEQLSALARAHNRDGITSRQLNFMRRLVKKAGFGDEALKVIAEEAKVSDVAQMTKEQASEVIDWLLKRIDQSKQDPA